MSEGGGGEGGREKRWRRKGGLGRKRMRSVKDAFVNMTVFCTYEL